MLQLSWAPLASVTLAACPLVSPLPVAFTLLQICDSHLLTGLPQPFFRAPPAEMPLSPADPMLLQYLVWLPNH